MSQSQAPIKSRPGPPAHTYTALPTGSTDRKQDTANTAGPGCFEPDPTRNTSPTSLSHQQDTTILTGCLRRFDNVVNVVNDYKPATAVPPVTPASEGALSDHQAVVCRSSRPTGVLTLMLVWRGRPAVVLAGRSHPPAPSTRFTAHDPYALVTRQVPQTPPLPSGPNQPPARPQPSHTASPHPRSARSKTGAPRPQSTAISRNAAAPTPMIGLKHQWVLKTYKPHSSVITERRLLMLV